MFTRWLGLTVVIVIAGLAVACGLPAVAAQKPTPVVDLTPPATSGFGGLASDYASLLDTLRATGVPVEPAGAASQPFFSVTGQRLIIAGAEVQAFEFDDEAAARTTTAVVSSDGQAVGDTVVKWNATPHFYCSGRLVAIYVGDDPAILSLLGAALGPQVAGGPAGPVATIGPVADRLSLVDALRAAGANVGAVGEITQPFFSVTGQVIAIDGQAIQVFEYAAAASAADEAAQVAPDGRAVGDSVVTWAATPHFFQAGRVTVLYVGENAETLARLTAVLGAQFAGGGAAL